MNTANLLIAFLLFIALLLTRRSDREAPIFEVPEGEQADDLSGLRDCKFLTLGP